uniref:transport and Golgi organization protein 1 homolog n=1 Tax=Callithrix jacchus TaxID=9483 RepID=UPI0023DD29E7|nr:transport and Golgi organization protein 1 homolog [Callithrix jacchus]
MQPPHEDNVSQENTTELNMQVPEEPPQDQPVMRDTHASEMSPKPHTEKDLDPVLGPITTEDPLRMVLKQTSNWRWLPKSQQASHLWKRQSF